MGINNHRDSDNDKRECVCESVRRGVGIGDQWQQQQQKKSMSTHREPDGDIIEVVRREVASVWGGHPDVWAISVQADAQGEPFVLLGLGYDAGPFPDTLAVEALNGRVVPLRTEVVGEIVPF
nr:hypothetical protein [Pandoravirus aubagnensis]